MHGDEARHGPGDPRAELARLEQVARRYDPHLDIDTGGLLLTKLSVPQPVWTPLRRPRLFDALDHATQAPLTLLAAPAGAGKTVLLASWIASGRPPGQVAWVTVDEDDTPQRLWGHVLAALRHSGAVPRTDRLPGMAAPAFHRDQRFLVLLANELAELAEPVVLVLDELHEASSLGVMADLRYLLRHVPEQLRLVLSTRVDPDLPLHRLRVAGDMNDIRAAELAFTVAEAGELLAALGVRLPQAELESLWARTEGWAAGLRLLATTLRDHPDPGRFVTELTGGDQPVAGYLVEEVLAGQSPEMRRFLLHTSVAERLCGELADELSGHQGSHQILARLEREHAFVTALGSQRSWYRYHPLFAQLLRTELRHEQPAAVPALQRRAAAWYAANGLPVDAVRHALLGEDAAEATTLLTGHWLELFANGQAATLAELLGRLPAERLRAAPELAAAAALCKVALGAAEEADAWLELADVGATTGARFDTARAITRLYQARFRGDLEPAAAAARALLSPPSNRAADELAGEETRRSLALTGLGAVELWSGKLDAAVHLQQAHDLAGRIDLHDVAVDAAAHLALAEVLNGRLTRAADLATEVLDDAGSRGWPPSASLAGAELALAGVCLHREDLAGAGDRLQRAARLARAVGDRPTRLAIALAEVWLSFCRGSQDAAGGLDSLRAAVARLPGGRLPLLAAEVRRIEARLLAATGDDAGALALLDDGGTGNASAEDTTALARLMLARGDPSGAIRVLAPHLDGPAPEPRLPVRIEAWLLDAVAREELADHGGATRSLEFALGLAAEEGYRRPFVEGGALVRSLLARHVQAGTGNLGDVGDLLEALARRAERAMAAGADMPVEPLSDRERIVLRYLSSMLSASEIAAELYVSVNTVKTHVRSIYRKLDANRRRDAVRRARELQLL